MEIEIMESVYAKNDKIAKELNDALTQKNVFAVNVMGAPGVGKTAALVQITGRLEKESFVVEGDIESDIDTQKLKSLGINTVQINTGGACHLDAPVVAKAVEPAAFENGFLFIENIGNLVCPAEFMIGEHIKLLICAATEGSDKPYKYPLAFEKADIILLNKCDLLPHLDFDWDFYYSGVRKLNRSVPVFSVSGKTGEGFDEVVQWLTQKAAEVQKK